MLATSWLLTLGLHALEPLAPGEDLIGYAQRVCLARAVGAGDVLVSVLDGATLDEVASVIAGDDVVTRGPEITDSYTSAFARRLLAVLGEDVPHHTQLRRFEIEGHRVLQVAVYPRPPASHGVRLWCSPALVWIFVEEDDGASVVRALEGIRPSWERLRAHHGPPLRTRLPQAYRDRYPVESPVEPVSDAELDLLCVSIENLVGQSCVQELLDGGITPREAVDSTLRGRRALTLHIDRVDKVLRFSHGDAATKVDLLREAVEAGLPTTAPAAREHLVAPHRHLVDGMRETQEQLAGAVAGASTTTALMSSAAVGRLLDRSRANRQASTAVAVGALLVAVLSLFTSLAAIPDRGRAVGDLVRLGSWVGAGGLLLVAVAYLVAVVSAIPAANAPRVVRRWAGAVQLVAGGLALRLFVAGGVAGSGLCLGAGVAAVFLAALVRAWADDY